MNKLLAEDRRLKSQGNLHDGAAFDRLADDVLAPSPAAAGEAARGEGSWPTRTRSYRDLDAPGLIGRSIDVNG